MVKFDVFHEIDAGHDDATDAPANLVDHVGEPEVFHLSVGLGDLLYVGGITEGGLVGRG